ncbi:MAG TPA: CIA30 family protein [Candidatus Polarisedimenticolia bacterium]|jgi:hypothetical protein|nr:CIA30 family protein [Candidatus Polarisedimenticolia bacterium]
MSRTAACAIIGLLALAGAAEAARGQETAVSIDDFEDRDLVAGKGSAWVPLGDDLLGGMTTLRLKPIHKGAGGSRGALRLGGTIGSGPGVFGGAWTAVADGGRAADLGRLTGLRLSLRGQGDVLIGVRSGPMAKSVNYMAKVTATPAWSTVEIPFSRLQPQGKGLENETWNPREARWLGVQTIPGVSGPFSIEIDDVAWIGEDGSGAAPVPAPGEPPSSRSLIPDDAAPLRALPWRELARDGEGDGRPGLPDARALFVANDPSRPLAWFRIDLQDTPPSTWMGVNLALDTDGDPANGTAWWGKNTAFHFDRLVTAWLFRVGEAYYGTVGIASVEEVAAMNLTNQEEVHFALDRSAKRVYIGVPAALVESGGARAVAAVGSVFVFSDDLPNEGGAQLGTDEPRRAGN